MKRGLKRGRVADVVIEQTAALHSERDLGQAVDRRIERFGAAVSAAFRHGLEARGLRWAVGIVKYQKVYAADVRLVPPTGRARKPVPGREPRDAEALLADLSWRRVTWRQGTKSKLSARFAAIRVRVCDGPVWGNNRHLPGADAWLVGEWCSSGERKYYLSNLSPDTSRRALAGTIKAG